MLIGDCRLLSQIVTLDYEMSIGFVFFSNRAWFMAKLCTDCIRLVLTQRIDAFDAPHSLLFSRVSQEDSYD